jgi:hypothetical protein
LDCYSQPAARHLTFLLELGDDRLSKVYRGSKANPNVAATLAENSCVNADHFTLKVEQGAA